VPQSLAGAASQLGCFLQRAPAQLEWQGRDRFVVTVNEPPAVAAARAAAEAEAAAAAAAEAQQSEEEPPQLKRPPLRIIYDGREQQRRGRGGARPDSPPRASGDDAASQAEDDGTIDVEVVSSGSDSEDVSVFPSPASQQQEQQQQREGVQDSEQQQQQKKRQQQGDAAAQESAALAEQIESLQGDLEAGRKPSKDKLNDIGGCLERRAHSAWEAAVPLPELCPAFGAVCVCVLGGGGRAVL
jgi:hypothetical protein